MENFIISFPFSDSPFQLYEKRQLSLTFSLNERGETLIDLVSSVPGGDWGATDKESAFVTLYLNGEYNQDFILFYGDEVFAYERMLGSLPPGKHELTFVFKTDQSSPLITSAEVHKVEIRQVKESDPDIVFYKNAPLLYGRNLDTHFENVRTDTPLASFYYCDEHEDGTMILEYHTIFSHEDGGTEAPALMSRWGRTTDIEWTYRVKVDQYGKRIIEGDCEVFQGKDHMRTQFRGKRGLGSHPILQSSTINGNYSDRVTSNYRYLLRPDTCLPREVNREAVMDKNPWTYAVSIKEVRRQEKIESPHNPQTEKLGDPCQYFYLQTSKFTVGETYQPGKVDIKVKLIKDPIWYSSTFNNAAMAYGGEDGPFSTTVKLPANKRVEDIEEIRASLITENETGIETVKGVIVEGVRKAFFVGKDLMPEISFINSNQKVEVSPANRNKTLWKK